MNVGNWNVSTCVVLTGSRCCFYNYFVVNMSSAQLTLVYIPRQEISGSRSFGCCCSYLISSHLEDIDWVYIKVRDIL